MNRPWQIAVAFTASLLVVLAALGWTSIQVIRLERAQTQEENIRLALWRMESALMSLASQEAARPYFEYSAFYSPDQAYGRMYNRSNVAAGPLVPSSILVQPLPYIRVYFQRGPDGTLTSPQVPTGPRTAGADPLAYTSKEELAKAAARLGELRSRLNIQALAAALPGPADRPAPTSTLVAGGGAQPSADQAPEPQGPAPQADQQRGAFSPQRLGQQILNPNSDVQAQADLPQEAPNQPPPQQGFAQGQAKRNVKEYQARAQTFQQMTAGNTANFDNSGLANRYGALGDVREGVMKAVWLDGELVLARRVSIGGSEYIQGAWLDWPAISQWLLDSVKDLVPQAVLVPVRPDDGPPGRTGRSGSAPAGPRRGGLTSLAADRLLDEQGRLLATLPVRLVPGPMPQDAEEGFTPLRLSLVVAWMCVLLAGVAVGVLLWGTVALSERRAAFVSAVTHELRTPLTTLRMYAEMLAAGMVPDEARRRQYLDTLRIEADRLGHLVENVLAYARLERGRARGRIEAVPVAQLVERVRGRLTERSLQAGMELAVEVPGDVAAMLVLADTSVVEQILFNLVDNACKYAAAAQDKRIHLVAERRAGGIVFKVCDHGPGISGEQAMRLFQPFSKSSHDAANSAPGVGLGLALSRRLARELGGDLTLEPGPSGGACFVLRLIS